MIAVIFEVIPKAGHAEDYFSCREGVAQFDASPRHAAHRTRACVYRLSIACGQRAARLRNV